MQYVLMEDAVPMKVDAVLMQWMQFPSRWMPYVVMEDSVIMKENAVILQSLQCTCSAISAGCNVPAVVAVPTSVSLKVSAVPTQWMQCTLRFMPYVVMGDAVSMRVEAVIRQ